MDRFYHYIISAKMAIERHEFMKKQFTAHNREPNFFDAIMGNEIPPEKWKQLVAPDGVLALTKGEVGCSLSHRGVYKQLIESGEKYCFVFEDDANLTDRFWDSLSSICDFMDQTEGPAVLLLFRPNDIHVRKIYDKGISIYNTVDGVCAHGYVLNREAAEKLIWAQTPIIFQADIWRTWIKAGLIKLYCLDEDFVPTYTELSSNSVINSLEKRPQGEQSNELKEKRKKALHYFYNKMDVAQRINGLFARISLHVREILYTHWE